MRLIALIFLVIASPLMSENIYILDSVNSKNAVAIYDGEAEQPEFYNVTYNGFLFIKSEVGKGTLEDHAYLVIPVKDSEICIALRITGKELKDLSEKLTKDEIRFFCDNLDCRIIQKPKLGNDI